MSFRVADNIHYLRDLADDGYPTHLSPAELAEQYEEMLAAPGDDEADAHLYAYAVWDAVNKRWIDDAV